jgi:hypothetical protein
MPLRCMLVLGAAEGLRGRARQADNAPIIGG